MKKNHTLSLLVTAYSLALFPITSFSEPKKGDEFTEGYVTKTEYNELDWEEFRNEKKTAIKKGVIDGFLSVKETSPGNYHIYLYETLEALEYNRPRRLIQIASDILREGLSSDLKAKNYTVLDKKWVRIYGIFEVIGKENNWLLLADTVRCDSVEWRNTKGELVRNLD
jgi:hypothetical protein